MFKVSCNLANKNVVLVSLLRTLNRFLPQNTVILRRRRTFYDVVEFYDIVEFNEAVEIYDIIGFSMTSTTS